MSKSKKEFKPSLPYDDIEGEWIERTKYNSSTSSTFGYFTCSKCKKNWMSSKVTKKYRQGCKSCKTFYFARFLWLNTNNKHKKSNEKGKSAIDASKPHLSHLCEACKYGKCSVTIFK